MLPLYLLAAHLLGDFVFQTRWQAAGKAIPPRGETEVAFSFRVRHVLAYCVPFTPLAIVYSSHAMEAAAFMAVLFLLHFLTDCRRFYSTLGDVIAWRFVVSDEEKIAAHSRPHPHPMMPHVTMRPSSADGLRLPSNPWPAVPLMIDQALHVCQLAFLGGLFFT